MSQLEASILRYHDAFNRRDLAGYDRLFTPDCVIEGPARKLRGIDGARAFDDQWWTAFPDGKVSDQLVAATGQRVICADRFAGRHTGPLKTPDFTLPPSGAAFEIARHAVFELDGERIKSCTLTFDRVRALEQLGGALAARQIAAARGVYEAFGRRDMPAILGALADDVTWGIDSAADGVPMYGVLRGKQNVPKFFAAFAEHAEFHAFAPRDFVAAGPNVYNLLDYELTVKATGKRVKLSSQQHWTFDATGKIAHWRGWEDTAIVQAAFRR